MRMWAGGKSPKDNLSPRLTLLLKIPTVDININIHQTYTSVDHSTSGVFKVVSEHHHQLQTVNEIKLVSPYSALKGVLRFNFKESEILREGETVV